MSTTSKSLVALEDVAFDVDRSRMIKVLQRSRLADRYAYIRNLLAISVETNARKVAVRGTPWKIVLTDNGEGIPYRTLDEKLANIFTEEEADDLATGILSSFQAGVREVTIETVPEREEPYTLIISSDEEEISVSEPEPLKHALKNGTRITLQKKQLLETSSWREWWKSLKSMVRSGGMPELTKIRESHAHSNLEIRVNFRTVKKKWETPKCLVEIPIDECRIRGRVGLLKEHGLKYYPSKEHGGDSIRCTEWANSPIHLYRKGLFQGFFCYQKKHMFTVPFGPIFAELNYDKLHVDISGKQLMDDTEKTQKIAGVLRETTSALYARLLEHVPVKDPARRAHLQFYSALHMSALLQCWREGQKKWEGEAEHYFFNVNGLYRKSAYDFSAIDPELTQKILHEKLYQTKEQEEVSLAFILNHLADGKPLVIDHRGFDYRGVSETAAVFSVNDSRDLAGLVLGRFTQRTNVTTFYPEHAGKHWLYTHLESPEALQLKESRNSLKEKLGLPILYRPAQAVATYYDTFIRSAFVNREKESVLETILPLLFSQAVLFPLIAPIMLGGSIILGTAETVNQFARAGIDLGKVTLEGWRERRLRSSSLEVCLITDGSAGAGESGLENALVKAETKNSHSLLRRSGHAAGYYGSIALRYAGGAAWGLLRTAGHYGLVGIGYSGTAIGKTLRTAGEYGLVGLEYTGIALRGAGRGVLIVGGAAGAAALGVASVAGGLLAAPFVLGYKGVKALSAHYSPALRAYLEQRELEKTRRRAIRQEKQESRGSRDASEGTRSSSRKKELQHLQQERFTELLRSIFSSSQFQNYSHYIDWYDETEKIQRLDDDLHSRCSYEWHIPLFRNRGNPLRVIIAAKDRRIKRLVQLVGEAREIGENFTHYLASAVIDACSLSKKTPEDSSTIRVAPTQLIPTQFEVAAFMMEYHQSILNEKMKEYMLQTIGHYQKGQAEEFLQQYTCLDRKRKIEVLYSVLGEQRQPSIDAALEADPDNIPLLDEAGRRRVHDT